MAAYTIQNHHSVAPCSQGFRLGYALGLTGCEFDFLDQIVKKITSTVFKQPIDAKLYKLNLYTVGGHFTSHVDTPINPELFLGSLVIALPSEHEGGDLIVTHLGENHVFIYY